MQAGTVFTATAPDLEHDHWICGRAARTGRQRGYVLHFTGAKQSKTRSARIEKCTPRILAGKGLNDR